MHCTQLFSCPLLMIYFHSPRFPHESCSFLWICKALIDSDILAKQAGMSLRSFTGPTLIVETKTVLSHLGCQNNIKWLINRNFFPLLMVLEVGILRSMWQCDGVLMRGLSSRLQTADLSSCLPVGRADSSKLSCDSQKGQESCHHRDPRPHDIS